MQVPQLLFILSLLLIVFLFFCDELSHLIMTLILMSNHSMPGTIPFSQKSALICNFIGRIESQRFR